MKHVLLALPLALFVPVVALAQPDVEWGRVEREELFATHFPEAPYAEAVVLLDHGVARVDSKERLKYTRHHRTKIFRDTAFDRGVVRIPYGKDDEIKNFRAQTIIPPGHLVEVEGNHRREEKLPDGSKVLVVEFPSLQPGVVLEYQYELRSDELHTIPVWPFRNRDFTRRSRFEVMIPEGMSYDATFSWVPGLIPRPQIRMINDPEEPSREIKQVAWELSNQAAVQPVPMGGDPERYRMDLFVQLREYTSTYRNFTVRRSWGEVGDEVAAQHAAFTQDDAGVSKWAETASASGGPGDVARALHRLVCSGIATDPSGPDVATSTLREVVASGKGTGRAKNLLLAHLLREHGIPVEIVLVRSHGPLQAKYFGASQFDHAILRAQPGGEVVWVDASRRGCPFGLIPPHSQADSGLRIAANRASALVELPRPTVESGRTLHTDATLDRNGTLQARSTIRYVGWEALEPRGSAVRDGGRSFVESILAARFGDAVVLDSLEIDALEEAGEPLTFRVSYHVGDYGHRSGEQLTLRMPYLTSLLRNPLPEGDREHPVVLGYRGTTEETVKLAMPDGWALPEPPARGSARTADLRYKLSHSVDGRSLSSQRTVRRIEETVTHDSAADLRTVFDKIVAMDTAEVTLHRQALRTSSAR